MRLVANNQALFELEWLLDSPKGEDFCNRQKAPGNCVTSWYRKQHTFGSRNNCVLRIFPSVWSSLFSVNSAASNQIVKDTHNFQFHLKRWLPFLFQFSFHHRIEWTTRIAAGHSFSECLSTFIHLIESFEFCKVKKYEVMSEQVWTRKWEMFSYNRQLWRGFQMEILQLIKNDNPLTC